MRPRPSCVLLLIATLLVSSQGCAVEGGDEQVSTGESGASGEVRSPVVAGAFYPGDPDVLARDVDQYLEAATPPTVGGELLAIISPHAGYMYSGGVAAHAYAYLKNREFDSVIVVAPSHRYPVRGASVFDGAGYETPLGVVDVDRDLVAAITDASKGIVYEPRAHASEHSLEVQVPFLQRTLREFLIVPVIMGDQSEGRATLLAKQIAGAVRQSGRRVLLVASTDLSHYHNHSTAVELDSRIIDRVNAFDPEGLLAALASGECEACGGGPTAVVMMAARELGADVASVVKYATSGDVTGDRSQVVGYMAAVLLRSESPDAGDAPLEDGAGKSEGTISSAPRTGLAPEEKRALLELARGSIEAALAGRNLPRATLESEALDAKSGAFVTLHKQGRLRGCIGYIEAVKPLRLAVSDMAIQAAFHDPRFPPVVLEELPELHVEISVLSPLEKVADVSEIEVGKHGLVIEDGRARGLLLPQVPVEYGWDRDTFLEHTCMKAGLPPDRWRSEGVTITKFTAEVFAEGDPSSSR